MIDRPPPRARRLRERPDPHGTQREIAAKLRRLHVEVEREPLPERLSALLRRLEAAERKRH